MSDSSSSLRFQYLRGLIKLVSPCWSLPYMVVFNDIPFKSTYLCRDTIVLMVLLYMLFCTKITTNIYVVLTIFWALFWEAYTILIESHKNLVRIILLLHFVDGEVSDKVKSFVQGQMKLSQSGPIKEDFSSYARVSQSWHTCHFKEDNYLLWQGSGGGGCPVYFKMFSSIPGLYLLDTNSIYSNKNKKYICRHS